MGQVILEWNEERRDVRRGSMGGGQQQESELYGVAAEPTVCHPWSPLSEMALAVLVCPVLHMRKMRLQLEVTCSDHIVRQCEGSWGGRGEGRKKISS